MISYIFTEPELKFLCGTLGVRGLAKHQFSENQLTDAECEQAIETLSEKDFIAAQSGGITVNSGIALLIGALGKARRLLIGEDEKIFTAYIADEISLLLINDKNSGNYMLYPFETEDKLVERLHEENIFAWKDIRLEEKLNG
ncbi:MAG: hypothetical protein OSJ61_01945 [Lachnospiraceae bacterium]|nr:hypothetical protein [Lachnospiraceae bacterium]